MMMSNHIDLATADMIRVALNQQASAFRGRPEHAGLMVALDIAVRFCAIPLADAAIAQARQMLAKTVGTPPLAAPESTQRVARIRRG